MNRNDANTAAEKVLKVLQQHLPEYQFEKKRGVFDLNGFTMKVLIQPQGAECPEAEWFRQYTKIGFGNCPLTPEDLGKDFTHNGVTYTITGMTQRNQKFPVVVRRHRDNKEYRFAFTAVGAALGRPKVNEYSLDPYAAMDAKA